MEHLKIEDTIQISGSKVQTYWTDEKFNELYALFRTPLKLPKSVLRNINSIDKIQETYKIKGFQFGNWSTNEDRFNYLATLYICFYDLNKVLKFPKANMGLDNALSLSFGARGGGSASAHFEPWSYVINMTRYTRPDVMRERFRPWVPDSHLEHYTSKKYRFLNTGGVGALAHEYGHFLDFFFGAHYDKDSLSQSLSRGSSTARKRHQYKGNHPLRLAMENLIMVLFWKNEEKQQKSKFIIRLHKSIEETPGMGIAYWGNRAEVFARSFEAFISYKLSQLGVNNKFLARVKYSPSVYPNQAETKALEPYFNKLFTEMRKFF